MSQHWGSTPAVANGPLGTESVPNEPFAPQPRGGAYSLAGVLLLLYGLVPVAWVIYSLVVTDAHVGEFLEQLVNPLAHGHGVRALTPYEWAFAVALIAVGVCALRRLPAARGGALLLSTMLLFLSIREGIGLLNTEYGEAYFASDEGGWVLATRLFGLVVAVAVLAAMLRTPQRPVTDERRAQWCWLAGLAMLVAGGVKLLFIGYTAVKFGAVGEYLRQLADPSDFSPLSMRSHGLFYDASLIVAMITVGVLAVRRRGVARGASLPLMGVVLYISVYTLVGTIGSPFGVGFGDPVLDALFWVASTVPVAAAVLVLPLMALARSDDEPPALDPAGFAPLPGDVGQQHPGGH